MLTSSCLFCSKMRCLVLPGAGATLDFAVNAANGRRVLPAAQGQIKAYRSDLYARRQRSVFCSAGTSSCQGASSRAEAIRAGAMGSVDRRVGQALSHSGAPPAYAGCHANHAARVDASSWTMVWAACQSPAAKRSAARRRDERPSRYNPVVVENPGDD